MTSQSNDDKKKQDDAQAQKIADAMRVLKRSKDAQEGEFTTVRRTKP